jgi:hypothetical protein
MSKTFFEIFLRDILRGYGVEDPGETGDLG